jgi:hypothetical protein
LSDAEEAMLLEIEDTESVLNAEITHASKGALGNF